MELRHIKYFLTLAEERNFTKAAEKLCIAQPPLSRQIKDLEEELGTELFVRTSRGVSLTDAGIRFQQYALQIDMLAGESIDSIKEMKQGLQGTLYIATVEGRAPELLAKWIADFHQIYPNVNFNLWNGNSDDVIQRLKNGLSDIALIAGPYDNEDLPGIKVFDEPWVAMISSEHPLARKAGGVISLSELADSELIIPSKQSRLQEITGWFSAINKKPRVVCRLAHMLDAYELAANNVGIAIYPAAADRYCDRTKVVIKKIVEPEVTASYYIVKYKSKEFTHLTKEFWNFVAKQYEL